MGYAFNRITGLYGSQYGLFYYEE